MAPTERFWCAEHSGYPELYKEDICICLCRVYVISYRVCPLHFAQRHSFGAPLRAWRQLCSGEAVPGNDHILTGTDITKLSVSLHRIQFQAGRGLAVTDWRVFVILPGRPQCYLPPWPPAPHSCRSRKQPPHSDCADNTLLNKHRIFRYRIMCRSLFNLINSNRVYLPFNLKKNPTSVNYNSFQSQRRFIHLLTWI